MSTVMENGELAVLNVGHGDTKLSFDPTDPAEVIRAGRIVKDMLRRGYALLIDPNNDGKLIRAKDFDENTAEYIIADFAPETAEPEPRWKVLGMEGPCFDCDGDTCTMNCGPAKLRTGLDDGPPIGDTSGKAKKTTPSKKTGKKTTRRVKARNTKGVAVAPTAGG